MKCSEKRRTVKRNGQINRHVNIIVAIKLKDNSQKKGFETLYVRTIITYLSNCWLHMTGHLAFYTLAHVH